VIQYAGTFRIHHNCRGVLGGFNRSSQHLSKGGCDEEI
jgi:hypothetical protein